MRLLDRIVQCNQPYIVASNGTGELSCLAGASNLAAAVKSCPLRYVMSDELTVLCTDLAYSKGTSIYDCIDLIRVPAETLWVEWCDRPWRERMEQFGFPHAEDATAGGRHGLLLKASKDGQRGSLRAAWTLGEGETDVVASAMEAYFYLDGISDASLMLQRPASTRLYVDDELTDPDSMLSRCFHFQFEASWEAYYRRHLPSDADYRKAQIQSAGAVALSVPVLLAFLLLLHTKEGLPQQTPPLERLNRARALSAKHPLLNHIEVRTPLDLAAGAPVSPKGITAGRRAPRLHHVRGHLMRRANQLIWRSPHLRGSARLGAVSSRTVTWTLERAKFVRA